jgi:hypothetical protein
MTRHLQMTRRPQMTRRLAGLMLLLYPLEFRRRYGQEMGALLDETPTRAMWGTTTMLLDLLRGALDAHLHPPANVARVLDTGDRLRASTSGVLACWVAFAAAGFGFYKTTEEHSFEAVGNAHPVLGGTHLTIQILAAIGSVAVLAGALPPIVVALLQARRQPNLRVLVCLPVAAVILVAGLTALLILLAHSQHSYRASTVGRMAFIVWGLAGLACGAVCVVASRRVLFAVALARGLLLAALACATLVTATMLAMALATALYTIALPFDASGLAGAPNGPLGLTSTNVSLIEQLTVMVIAGTLAAITTQRGWRAAMTPLDSSEA